MRSVPQRLLASACIGLLLWGALAALAHPGDHRHRYCPDHQAFEDVSESAELAAPFDSPLAWLFAVAPRTDEHRACAEPWVLPRATAKAALPCAMPLASTAQALLKAGTSSAFGPKLLLLAPKLSPPARPS
jgi:hypothetical protein